MNSATAASERGRRGGRIGHVGRLGEVHVAVDEARQQPAAGEIDDHVVGAGPGGWHELGDAIAVDADVGSDEPLPCRVQHHAPGEPETATRLIHSTNLATVDR